MIHIIDLHFLQQKSVIASFLVETSAGPILIETGPHSTFPNLTKGIEAAGYRVQDIQHVFLTHIHLDHAGAAWAFAEHGATIYVHPFGAKHLANPTKLMSSAKRIYREMMDTLWGDMRAIPQTQIIETAHNQMFTIGDANITAWHTPGHAVHHIAWQIGETLFTGDVAGVQVNNSLVIPPCPPPDINLEAWQASIQLIRSLEVADLYLTHFGKATGPVDKHLTELETRLLKWANWMKPYWQQGAKTLEVVPAFQQMVRQEYLDAGMDEATIAQYEGANPSAMSVGGLLRYWRKR